MASGYGLGVESDVQVSHRGFLDGFGTARGGQKRRRKMSPQTAIHRTSENSSSSPSPASDYGGEAAGFGVVDVSGEGGFGKGLLPRGFGPPILEE